ncbi:MAG: hypothetical protein HY814_08765, partial [Candidatus Riflebacteria bacterium]|nr:hypothetical protein [Candidatus Riflebacteria bacterium]
LGKFDDATAQFQGILDLVPDNPYAKRYLGLCQQGKNAPQPGATPSGGTPAAGVKAAISSPGQVKTPPATPEPAQTPAPEPARAGSRAAYLWWGLGAFGAGRVLSGILLSVLELVLIGAAAVPWTPLWAALAGPPSGPLVPLFQAGGPLQSLAVHQQWVFTGPAVFLLLILEMLIPARLARAALTQ